MARWHPDGSLAKDMSKKKKINVDMTTFEQMQALVAEINATDRWPKISVDDVIREALKRTIEERPAWLGLGKPWPKQEEPMF